MSTNPPSDPGAAWGTPSGDSSTQDLFDQLTGSGTAPIGPPPGWGATNSGAAPIGPPPGWGATPFTGTPIGGAGPTTFPGQFTPGPFAPGPFAPNQFAGPTNQPMQPRRRTGVRLAGWLIALAGVALAALGVWRIVDGYRWRNDRVVASAQDTARTLELAFDRTDSGFATYTVDIRSTLSGVVPTYAERAACEVTLADGTTRSLTAAGDSIATSFLGYAVVGSFRAPTGRVSVACKADFTTNIYVVVVRGPAPSVMPYLAWAIVGVVVLIAGSITARIGGRQRWVPVDLPS